MKMFFFFFNLVLDLDQMWIRWTRSQHNENRRNGGVCSSKQCFKNQFSMKFMRTAHQTGFVRISRYLVLCCVTQCDSRWLAATDPTLSRIHYLHLCRPGNSGIQNDTRNLSQLGPRATKFS